MAKAFTTKAVEALKPDPSKRVEVPDPALSGLYLVVQPSGAKSWAVRYRHAGKPKKLTLGRWPLMGVADARAAASEAIDTVEHGKDPSAAKKATKAARLEAQLTERDKVKTLIDQFDRRHLSTLKSGEGVRWFLDRFVLPAWGELDIHEITKRDVIDLLDGIVESGRATTANRVRAHLSKFFGWCAERDILDASPMIGIKAPAKETSRDRVLSDDEIRWLWMAADRIGQPWGALAQLLLLTGQRRGEVVAMTDDELDGDTWHLPAARTKNKRAHDVPLSAPALAILDGVERIKSKAGYVFTTTGRAPVSGLGKGHEHLVAAMAEIASEEAGEPVEIERWTFHDLRRTAATGMAKIGISPIVIESALNHVSGTKAGVAGIYNRHAYLDETRSAMEAWARYAEDLVEGKTDNVVRIAEAAR